MWDATVHPVISGCASCVFFGSRGGDPRFTVMSLTRATFDLSVPLGPNSANCERQVGAPTEDQNPAKATAIDSLFAHVSP